MFNSDFFNNTSAGGYEIANSLRFNDNDSAYLSRTPSSAGNRKTWTWSLWVKPTNISDTSNHQNFITAGTGDAYICNIYYENSTRKLVVGEYDQGNGNWKFLVKTDAVYRDPSAWYHITVAFDTTQSTGSDRIKIYVNGSLVDRVFTYTPAQNSDSGFMNTTTTHFIGRWGTWNGSHIYDGYLAEVNFIDGQALDQSNFGETGDYGEWKPIKYTGTYGTNGFYLDFSGAGTKHTITANGNVQHSTAQSKMGSSSILFDGTGDYLSVSDHNNFNFGSDDFTIEGWVYPETNTTTNGFYSQRTFGSYGALSAFINTANKLQIVGTDNGSSPWDFNVISSSSVTLNTWTHIAFQRNGSEISLWINGTKDSTTGSFSGSLYDDSNSIKIGYGNDSGQEFDGYIDEFRVSNTARYTSSFTPSTTAFTEDSNTLLLIHSDTTNGSTTFTDSSGVDGGLGNDQSGSENHWTPTNLAATDQMLDSPTNNFATWNAVEPTPTGIFAEGNTHYYANAVTTKGAVAGTMGFSGKFYWEVFSSSTNQYHTEKVGIVADDFSVNQNIGYDSVAWGYGSNGSSQYKWNNNSGTFLGSRQIGDIQMIAVDTDAGKVWFGRNGTWEESGNPATGANAQYTNVSSVVRPATSVYNTQNGIDGSIANFGQDSSFAGNKTAQGNTDDNGYGDFYYSPPTGFNALCTANLDAISTPYQAYSSCATEDEYKQVTYTGNGSSDGTFIYLGFKPTTICIDGTSYTNASTSAFDFLSNGIKCRSTTKNANGTSYTLEAWVDVDFKYGNAEGN